MQFSIDAYHQDGEWVTKRLLHFLIFFLTRWLQQVPASVANLKKVIARIFERTGWEIKELFTEDELADMIDEVVKEPPHM